ncbi:39S ribosomal protein L18, mitochondrial-like [Mizuhopecten yessoensis]|uniref:39S ribosomal protein L18, mitochondrial n=1 Tax=Mizuhopecten yessoensis TaxID=6573 RepID=A0A210QYB5_MIZYE|nr:39S ribosomal protein L18, mitochondrial-like [Mizuhopecten yessoensis]OWF53714.1 39S ribosomal protein L18, mitochondrial [Mizuhopecten yessoensis]
MALLLGGKLQHSLTTGALTCVCRNVRCCSVLTSDLTKTSSPNADYEINPLFRNRNPRNLEKMALAWKATGWQFQKGIRNFYHRLSIQTTSRKTTASVEHCSGAFTLQVSTESPEIKRAFAGSGCSRVTKVHYLGQVIAQRCLEAGITHIVFDPPEGDDISPKDQSFIDGLEKMKMELTEPEMIKPIYRPGIDYSKPNRYAERKKYKRDIQVA